MRACTHRHTREPQKGSGILDDMASHLLTDDNDVYLIDSSFFQHVEKADTTLLFHSGNPELVLQA